MRRLAVLIALAALSACGEPAENKLTAPDAKPGIVAKGAPADFAEPAAEAVRIEARLGDSRIREHVAPSGARIWSEGDATAKVVQTIPGGERTAWFRNDDPRPFLIREPDAAFAYFEGRPIYAYDPEGRPVEMTDQLRQRAEASLADVTALLTTP